MAIPFVVGRGGRALLTPPIIGGMVAGHPLPPRMGVTAGSPLPYNRGLIFF
jgi:hypothetical protein